VSTSSSWLEIVVGLTPGQQKVTFRVEKAAFEPPFARTSQFGSGFVYIDDCTLSYIY
jgi:hypothetical protein